MKSKASEKASFYHQLGNLLAGAVGLRLALETLNQHLSSTRLKKVAKDCLVTVQNGQPFYIALAQRKDWFEAFEIALFEAGEKAGQLSEISYQLSEFWTLRDKTQRHFFKELVYPFFLIHFAFLTSALLQEGALGFFNQLVGCLGVFYAILLGTVLLFRFYRISLQEFLVQLGWLRSSLLAGPLYRFVFSLRLQLQAAVPLLDAVAIAFQASDHPSLKKMSEPVIAKLKQGASLTEALEPIFLFSPYLKSFFATGEASGKILESLQFIENDLAQQWQEALKNWGRWLARFFYFIAALYVAIQVFYFYKNYYSVFNSDL